MDVALVGLFDNDVENEEPEPRYLPATICIETKASKTNQQA